jgi:FMN phosphatase YigB (HAD superfamily)
MAIHIVFFDLGDTLVRVPGMWLPGAQSLLGTLREAGFRLGVISNTAGLATRQEILGLLPNDFDLNTFDQSLVFFSSEVGQAKPNQGIFLEALARAEVPAQQCLYCSENILETLVAQEVGMHSVRVQTAPHSDLAALPQILADFHALL